MARHGSRVVFIDSSVSSVISSDSSIATVSEEKEKIAINKNGTLKTGFVVDFIGVGYVDLTVNYGNKTKVISFFSWNYRLRKDSTEPTKREIFSEYDYSDINRYKK